MVVGRLAVAILIVGAALPAALGDDSSFGPVAAFAITTHDTITLAWVPGPAQADSFIVYGVNPTGAVFFIESVPGTQTTTAFSAPYTNYAIAGIHDGIESAPVMAVGGGVPCANASLSPPAVWVGCLGVITRIPPPGPIS